MLYTIYQGEKTEVRKNGIPVIRASVRGFFTLKLEIYLGDKLVFKANHFTIAFYRSIKITYQDLPDQIELLKTNSFSYNLLYQGNELSIRFRIFKEILFKNLKEIGTIKFPKGITFGYSLTEMDLNSDDENLALYFSILYFLFNPKSINK
jgi:hypothetical protein